jgi:AbrB family looped-hinge helix DNA binding protein
MESIVKIRKNYQITLPHHIIKELKIKPGDVVSIDISEKKIFVHPKSKTFTEYISGLGKEVWRGLGGAEKYIKSERDNWD